MTTTGTMTSDRKPRALLLARDDEALSTLAAGFGRRGFDVLVASDGVHGLELLIDNLLTLDVLVTDLELPGRDGASLLGLVRLAGGERELAIVVRCAGLTAHERGVLRALGADALVGMADGPDAVAALAEEAIAARTLGLALPPLRLADGAGDPPAAREHQVRYALPAGADVRSSFSLGAGAWADQLAFA